MTLTLTDLSQLRAEAVKQHQGWKRRSFTLDAITADEWQTVWDDLTVEIGKPLVENTALQALEDSVASAAGIRPRLIVSPTRGTRSDRAEKNAELRRRVYQSYWDRSGMDRLRYRLFMDWFGHSAAYLYPQADLYATDGTLRPSAERFPYQVRVNPRHVYPLAHNSQDRLTAAIKTCLRNVKEIEDEYGENHPGLAALKARWVLSHLPLDRLRHIEETWYFDEDVWAVAITARNSPMMLDSWRYVSPINDLAATRFDEWLVPPTPHGLGWCPLAEAKRVANDGEYRAPIDSSLPPLRTAQTFMARILDQLADATYGPVLMENILNPEDYGPNAELIGNGQGNARVEYPRPPVNFEAHQIVSQSLQASRRNAKHPEQRAGEAGVSIGSARHTESLMGAFNEQLRQAHTDIAGLLQWANVLCASYDETHCAGRKQIEGQDPSGGFVETYDPAVLFKGDYRNAVTYGAATGLDQQNLLTRMALARNMKGISLRTFMRETGLVDDPLQEERDILIEDMTAALLGVSVGQASQAGNTTPMQILIEKLDGDEMTVRQAITQLVKEMQTVPEGGAGGQAAGVPGPMEADPMRMMASLGAGGSGVEDGLSDTGRRLRQVLPRGMAQRTPQ